VQYRDARPPALRIFQRLAQISAFRREHLPFIRTLEDLDLVREIALHQMMGEPATLKTLFLKGIASVATVQRRLDRLKRLGVVEQGKAEHDKRLVRLTLSPPVWRIYRRLDRLMVRTR
jgi:DNA-binding MarR family transcriptional regulator